MALKTYTIVEDIDVAKRKFREVVMEESEWKELNRKAVAIVEEAKTKCQCEPWYFRPCKSLIRGGTCEHRQRDPLEKD